MEGSGADVYIDDAIEQCGGVVGDVVEDVSGDGDLAVGVQGFLGALDGFVVAGGVAGGVGGEECVCVGFVDDAEDGVGVLDGTDGGAIVGEIVCEVSCAVDWVDDPPYAIGFGGWDFEDGVWGAFFGDKTVVREVFLDQIDDHILALAVELSDDF